MESAKSGRTALAQRWLASALVITNICFNYLSPLLQDGRSIREVSDNYSNLFMPSPYVFGIWGLIYGVVLVYAFVQVLPGQKNERAYTVLAFPLSFISILSMCWLLSFVNELLVLSEIIIAVMLSTAVLALIKAKRFAFNNELGQWAVVPFSMYAGWLSVAAIANTSAWLVSEGYQGGMFGQERWTVIVILLAVALGVFVSFRLRDIVYPAMIAWGIIGIWASWQTTSTVSAAALVGGTILIIVIIINLARFNWRATDLKAHSYHKG